MSGYITHRSARPRLSTMPSDPQPPRASMTEDQLRRLMIVDARRAGQKPGMPEVRKPYPLGHETAADKVLKIMRRDGAVTLAGIAEELGIRKDAASNAIHRLRKLGFEVLAEKGDRNTYSYSLEEKK